MVQLFDNDETGYLSWVLTNPRGFVANIDRAQRVPQYPMVHAATHGSLVSSKIGNFTTGDYIKFCCTDLDALEQYSQSKFGRSLTLCSICM
ncbi:MAG: hypothetical protein EON58_16630 [Alphaproteobacteria bacterium]|nr:MAG: hypothetical protein EON58_16630 [Alphaproteobacteria bacterium]